MVIIFNGVVIVKRNCEAFCYITGMDTVDPSRWTRVKKYIAKRNLEILYIEDLKYTNPQ